MPLFTYPMCLQNCKKEKDLDLNEIHESWKIDDWIVNDNFLSNCDYIDLDSCKNIDKSIGDLCIMQLNIRGLVNKQKELQDLLCNCTSDNQADVVLLVETWLTQESLSRLNFPGYKFIGKNRLSKKGGGVGILVRDGLTFSERTDISMPNKLFESCFIEIKGCTAKIICGSIYRPPSTSAKEFVENYSSLVSKLKENNKKTSFIIGMDHNLDFLKHDTYSHTQDFLELIAESQHFPCITRPTRITYSSATLIDNIMMSVDLYNKQSSSIVLSDISDHLPCISIVTSVVKTRDEPQSLQKRKYCKKNIEELKQELSKFDWKNILEKKSAEDSMNTLHSILLDSLDKTCPEKSVRVSTNHKIKESWMTVGLLKCSKKQLKLYQYFLKNRTKANEIKYKDYRNLLKKIKRNCRQQFYLEKCTELKNNTKKMWQLVNSVIHKTQDKRCIVNCLSINNLKSVCSKDIVNEFAKYFSNIGRQYANNINPSNTSIDEYIAKIPRNSKTMCLYPTTESEIGNIIDSLVNKQSSGWDGISNKLLKSLRNELLEPLNIVFNRSISEGIFPSSMKLSHVTPLYKSGKKDSNTNYRPISLLITVSKVLEKIIYKRTYNFLVSTNQLYQSQYGFRKKHSCEHAIQELVGNVLKGFENKEYTAAIFLDLSKAFDTLEHSVLLKKLETYGIRGLALEWYRSYLSNRSLSVKCQCGEPSKNEVSIEYEIDYGVPQGSCLGPLLFLAFCNDLPLNLTECNGILFADDTTIYKKHRNLNYLMWAMSEELKRLMDWFKANKLTLNLKKSVTVLFTEKNTHHPFTIEIDGVKLPTVESTKFLGVWIDSNLNWQTHMSKLMVKLKQNVNLLKTGKNFLNIHAKKLVYFSHWQSHLTYGMSIWGNLIKKNVLSKIEKLQENCIRLISSKKSSQELRILTVTDLIKHENLKFGFKLKEHLLPPKVIETAVLDQKGNSLRKRHGYKTRNKTLINLPIAKNKKYLDSVFCQGTYEFSLLPAELKKIPNLCMFVKKLKNYLLEM